MEEIVLQGRLDVKQNDILITDKFKEAWFELPVKGSVTIMQLGRNVNYIRTDDVVAGTNVIKLNPVIFETCKEDSMDVTIVKLNGELLMSFAEGVVKAPQTKKTRGDELNVYFGKVMKRVKPTITMCKSMLVMLLENQIAALDDEVESFKTFVRNNATP